MLGKLRLKPSLVLEVVFMLAVWLVAWKVLDAPVVGDVHLAPVAVVQAGGVAAIRLAAEETPVGIEGLG